MYLYHGRPKTELVPVPHPVSRENERVQGCRLIFGCAEGFHKANKLGELGTGGADEGRRNLRATFPGGLSLMESRPQRTQYTFKDG